MSMSEAAYLSEVRAETIRNMLTSLTKDMERLGEEIQKNFSGRIDPNHTSLTSPPHIVSYHFDNKKRNDLMKLLRRNGYHVQKGDRFAYHSNYTYPVTYEDGFTAPTFQLDHKQGHISLLFPVRID